jgi:hypothetical protein
MARRNATEAGVVLLIAPVHAVTSVARTRYDHTHVDHRFLILGLRRFLRRLPGVDEDLSGRAGQKNTRGKCLNKNATN